MACKKGQREIKFTLTFCVAKFSKQHRNISTCKG